MHSYGFSTPLCSSKTNFHSQLCGILKANARERALWPLKQLPGSREREQEDKRYQMFWSEEVFEEADVRKAFPLHWYISAFQIFCKTHKHIHEHCCVWSLYYRNAQWKNEWTMCLQLDSLSVKDHCPGPVVAPVTCDTGSLWRHVSENLVFVPKLEDACLVLSPKKCYSLPSRQWLVLVFAFNR